MSIMSWAHLANEHDGGGVCVGRAQEQRDAQAVLATMDHADNRGLITALHLSVAGLPVL